MYHNNILPNAASALDHLKPLPAKGIRNTALMSVSAEGISSYTHTPSQERGRVWCHDYTPVVPMLMLVVTWCANHTHEDLAPGW